MINHIFQDPDQHLETGHYDASLILSVSHELLDQVFGQLPVFNHLVLSVPVDDTCMSGPSWL